MEILHVLASVFDFTLNISSIDLSISRVPFFNGIFYFFAYRFGFGAI